MHIVIVPCVRAAVVQIVLVARVDYCGASDVVYVGRAALRCVGGTAAVR